ncbi:glycosyltransferase [Streptococcus himalayensis]|uniref:Glycosyltransferase Gtf1 n=1 Tax=Streptococcus himalayensis TaxID=1888195 RepID=A0A917AC71_9STRE|nr:glycosyltransferase [Streptococcus himalayensis]GGE37872.1 glycosyltransferase Gtf1 [Streptococcus himalayensis]
MIYIFNERLTLVPSGVEYAEVQLANLLRELDIDFKFIFAGWTGPGNLVDYGRKVGYQPDDLMSIYHLFTDLELSGASLTVDKILPLYSDYRNCIEKSAEKEVYQQGDYRLFLYLFDSYVSHAMIEKNGILVQVDYYTSQLSHSEFFNRGQFIQREFYNKDGSCALKETVHQWDSSFEYKDYQWSSKQEFMKYVMNGLDLKESDTIILDRYAFIDQDILPFTGKAKVIATLHSEHFMRDFYPEKLVFNPHYQYIFRNSHLVDVFRVMTQAQKELLGEHLDRLGIQGRIEAIPPTYLAKEPPQTGEKLSYRLLTASRIAPEKRLDLLVQSIVKASQELPQLQLAIYGGGDQESLQELIDSVGMQDKISLKGHTENVVEYYSQYDAYISSSPGESFGLSTFDALGQGLPLIVRKVPYGNLEMVEGNGILVEGEADDEVVENMAKAIVQFYQEDRHVEYQKNSLAKALQYTKEKTKQQWKELLESI